MKTQGKALIVFLRYPRPGKVKSRLAAKLGEHRAAEVYEKLVRRTLGVATDFKRSKTDLHIFAFFTPADRKEQLEESFPGPWKFVPQRGSHIGERMDLAIRQTLSSGYKQVVLVGTDIVNLENLDFQQAFEDLEHGFAVLNPATDGGFYLIGLNRPCPSALAPKEWGTADVFRRTRDLLEKAGFRVQVNRQRQDIDRPEDIPHLHEQALLQNRMSVIVPTRRDTAELKPMLDALKAQLWPGDEIILSTCDRSPQSEFPAGDDLPIRLVRSAAGRGIQLNRGAHEAQGNLFWFLHDDSLPPDQFGYFIRQISQAPDYSLGCFLLGYAPSSPGMDLIAHWANFRTRRLGFPYGDQGLFCRSEVFRQLGGYRRRFIMEDVDFVRRSQQIGKLLVVPETLHTSPRRYLSKGILRASLKNHLTMLLYLLGIDEHTLVTFYYR